MNGTTLEYVTTPKAIKKIDKIMRYGWEIQDKPGTLKWISKQLLEVDESYQREHNRNKAREIAAKMILQSESRKKIRRVLVTLGPGLLALGVLAAICIGAAPAS